MKTPTSVIVALMVGADTSGGPKACWPWRGGKDKDGYGRLYANNQDLAAHRCALELKLGRSLADDQCALHDCDNPPCCNPDHLFEGTKLDNNKDCLAKGRICRGDRHPNAKLTDAQADEIRTVGSQYHRGVYSELARRFGVSERMVRYIVNGDKRVPQPAPEARP